MAECHFLRELKILYAGIFTMTFTAPCADHPRKWIEVGMKTFRDLERHYCPRFNLRHCFAA
jgi:hypothetical protein